MNKLIQLDIYAVISNLSAILDECKLKSYDDLIDQILKTSNEIISVTKLSGKDILNPYFEPERVDKLFVNNLTLIKFTTYEESKYSDDNTNHIAREIFELNFKSKIINDLIEKISNLITCCNISMPGIVALKKTIIYIDEKFYRLISNFQITSNLQLYCQDADHSLFNNFSIIKVLNWYMKVSRDENGNTNTPLGKALSALNQIIYTDINVTIAYVWTCIAIEAIYCVGAQLKNQGKSKQIASKFSAIFANINISNKIKKMYPHRSQLIHGSMRLPIYPHTLDHIIFKENGFTKASETMYDYFTLNLNLLFFTLQFMFQNNKMSLDFEVNEIERSYRLL